MPSGTPGPIGSNRAPGGTEPLEKKDFTCFYLTLSYKLMKLGC